MRQENFQINKIVISIYKLETRRRHDLNALALIVQGCWIEGVRTLLSAGAPVHGQPTDNTTTERAHQRPRALQPRARQLRAL